MAAFASHELPPATAYRLMTSVIVPRPIALVATRDAGGRANLAPFSFFNGVSHTPPTLAFAIGPGEDGRTKDTARNLDAHPAFIVHVVTESMVEGAVTASADVPPEVDEFRLAGWDAVPGTRVDVPRIGLAPVALECRLLQVVTVGSERPTRLVVGEILYWHIDDAVLAAPYRVATEALHAVGRMAAGQFCRTDSRFTLPHPRP